MKDKISALLDGSLDEREAGAVLDALARDEKLREHWRVYCMGADALRGDTVALPGFSDRVMAALDAEPTVLAPAAMAAVRARRSSRWQTLLPIAASVMGVAAVGWMAYALNPPPASQQVAVVAKPAPVAAVRPAAPAQDDPYREYLVAHQAQVGSGPMPGVARYVRSVSEVRQEAR